MTQKPKNRSPMAKALSERQYQQKIVKPRKGKGSYTRKDKHKDAK